MKNRDHVKLLVVLLILFLSITEIILLSTSSKKLFYQQKVLHNKFKIYYEFLNIKTISLACY